MGRCKININDTDNTCIAKRKNCCHECDDYDCKISNGCEPYLPLDACVNSNRSYIDCKYYQEGEDNNG